MNITYLAEGTGKKIISSRGVPLTNDFAGGKRISKFIGYDGSCPPWNDARLHHYHFKIYALDVASLGVKEGDIGKKLFKILKSMQLLRKK